MGGKSPTAGYLNQNVQLIDIATRNLAVMKPAASVLEATALMASRKISSVVVEDGNKLVGIVTERDILKATQTGLNATLSGIMSTPVITVPATTSLLAAYPICLKYNIRHLVIVEASGTPLGIVSETDFRRHLFLSALTGRLKVGSIAVSSPLTLPPETPLKDALAHMQERNKHCIVALQDNKPVGILTDRDVVRLVSDGTLAANPVISEVMSAPVLTILNEESCNSAAELMLAKNMRQLVVVDEYGAMTSLLNEHDLTHSLLDSLTDEKAGLDESFLRTLINTLPDLVWLKDKDGVYLACNTRFEQFFGAREAEIVGKTDFDFMPREHAEFFRAHDRAAIERGGATVNEEEVTFAIDGHKELLETIKTPMHTRNGDLIGVLGIARDITVRTRLESEIEYSEEKLRTIYDSLVDGIEIVSADGRLLEINRAGLELMGLTREEAVGRKLSDFVRPEAAHRIQERMELMRKEGSAVFESLRIHKDGKTIPIEVRSRLVKYEGVDAFLSIVRDISERYEAEQKLRISLAMTESVINAIPDLLFELDANGRYINIWAHDPKLLTAQRELLLGRTANEMLSKEAAATVMSAIGETVRTGKSSGQVIALDLPQGKSYFELSTAAKAPANHAIPHVMMLSRDVTARVTAEQQLRESDLKLRSLYELAPMGIALTSMQGQYLEFNDAFGEICGYDREELNKLDYWALTPKEYAQKEAEQLESLNTKGYYGPYEKEYIRKDGTRIPLLLNGVLIRDHNGTPYIWSIVEDITYRKRAELKLQQSEAHFRFVTESAQAMIWMSGPDKRCTWFNKVWLDFTGRTMEQEQGDGWVEGMHPDDVARCLDNYNRHFDARTPFTMEYRLWRHDGQYRWVMDIGSPRFGRDGEFEGYIGSCFDITERKRNEEALRVTASVFDTTQEGIIITDANNFIMDVNPAFTRITGYSREEVIGKNPKILGSGRQNETFYKIMWQTINTRKSWRGEIWNRRKNGDTYAELLSISTICDENGDIERHIGVFSDISHIKAHEAELSRVAHYDALTGIPNRLLLADRMKQAIAQTAREKQMMAVCYLDLDGFKPVNDTLGHEAGDQVLITIARRIENIIRGGDTVARLGGDEFVILLLGLERGNECTATLDRLIRTISEPVEIKDKLVSLGASIGVSIYPLDDEDPDTLLRHADHAMYIAKQSGKSRFHIYDPEIDLITRSKYELANEVKKALKLNQFELFYQPKVHLSTREFAGAEALLRWHHPDKGLLGPLEFLSKVENPDVEVEVGNWVIHDALRQLDEWRREGIEFELSINISAYHLESTNFAATLESALARFPEIKRGNLQIEVLETTSLNNLLQVRDVMEACRRLGVRFALDDFGTGYSSLFYLSNLPTEVLKIDQTFVRDMLDDDGDLAIVRGVIALAQVFGRETVAEGVETDAQYRLLKELGCQLAQGYGIARPMCGADLIQWRAQKPPATE